MEHLTVFEVGGTISSRYCGAVLASLGIRVVGTVPVDCECENVLSGRFNSHLDAKKVLTGPLRWDQVAAAVGGAGLIVIGGAPAEISPLLPDLLKHAAVLSITPFGIRGGDSAGPGGDVIAGSSGGYSHYLSEGIAGGGTDEASLYHGPRHQASLYAGLCGAVAALSLLWRGTHPEPGRLIDVSEQECIADLVTAQIQKAQREGPTPPRRTPPGAAVRVAGGLVGHLPCSDGLVLLSPREPHQWVAFGRATGATVLTESPDFRTPSSHFARWDAVVEAVGEWSRSRTRAEVCEALQAHHVPCFPVHTIHETRTSPSRSLRRPWREDGERLDFVPALPFEESDA